jgi:hypothetical protein
VIHPDDCECPLYGCELRRKGVQYAGSATPTSRARKPFRESINCSWEAGVAGETRPDGSRMPYLDGTGRKIRVKEYGENRRKLSDIRSRQVQGPAPQE